MPPDLALLSTLIGSNYPFLELIFMLPKEFEPLKFDSTVGCSLRKDFFTNSSDIWRALIPTYILMLHGLSFSASDNWCKCLKANLYSIVSLSTNWLLNDYIIGQTNGCILRPHSHVSDSTLWPEGGLSHWNLSNIQDLLNECSWSDVLEYSRKRLLVETSFPRWKLLCCHTTYEYWQKWLPFLKLELTVIAHRQLHLRFTNSFFFTAREQFHMSAATWENLS